MWIVKGRLLIPESGIYRCRLVELETFSAEREPFPGGL